jgi:hypothetical protein
MKRGVFKKKASAGGDRQ